MEIIKFRPILKQVLWGGNKIIPFKQLDADMEQVGESWEVSGVKDNESIVANGQYEGMKLNDLVALLKGDLVGKENYERFGNEFPLLIKFIDASKQLSIQVHPNDEQAKAKGLKRGKTEMWYIMESAPDATLLSGLKRTITPEEYKAMVENDTITDVLCEYRVGEGDVFYLPAGRIHSIGAGTFLAEIQETSDITYRIYDFKRKDKDGNYRQLHTEAAAECIDYSVENDYRTKYEARKNEGVELAQCAHFATSVYDLDEPMLLDYSELDSFVVLIALSGECTLSTGDAETQLRAGETVLLPATTQTLNVSGTVKFLETFV
ncbi:mannose-6-phosphate isomerase [Prevotella intermedia ATCC 25611 = DSM 20706]|uniref:type I phosphomannose isomerase catalytic subunit n=1 Tax=Prevotella intermedia TaxID=28131 RepID=UPI00048EAF90|nr:type I phosphomannose isomerase catalytic subunit [Prevotella intermedia]APW32444.1 mannose-6-phosphate isomerase [Prevotella intermedia ATCC 25611 = DSM 20706]SUB95427.1 Probable mannose-6-phosphate isomerase gmuF [Prevotella intermedia]